jgi:hypothetical protein
MVSKKIVIVSLITLTSLITPLSVSAQTATSSAQQNRLDLLHTRCDTEITKRLDSLNQALMKISQMKKLPSDQKNSYSAKISSNISGLTTLKSTCKQDADLTVLRDDSRSVYTKYRIYAVLLPQTYLLSNSDSLAVLVDQLTDFASKLQLRLGDSADASTKTLLADMQSKIADAKTQYQNAQNLVSNLTPDSYNTDPVKTKAAFTLARTAIKNGTTDLKAAWQDAKQIRATLKPSPSAT